MSIPFFVALSAYLSMFHTSPPHSMINDVTIPLHIKVQTMNDAVTRKEKLYG